MLIDGAQLDAPRRAARRPAAGRPRGGPRRGRDRLGRARADLARAGGGERRGWPAATAALGLEPGDRLASLMPNRIDLVVHYLACFKAGLIATPLNYRYTAREIDHALEVSGARALLAHVERAEDVAASELAGGLELGHDRLPRRRAAAERRSPGATPAGATTSRRCSTPSRCPRPTPPDPAAPAAIFFTSGSTGPAKGVTHTRESLRWMIASAAARLRARRRATSSCPAPRCRTSAPSSGRWRRSRSAAGSSSPAATDAHELLPLLREHQPTVLAMIPAALSALIHDHDLQPGDFSSLRICRAGADKVSTELLTEFAAAAGFPIVEGYGMTEVGLATLNPPSGEIKQGSIGPPICGFSIALRDEDGEPIEAGDGRPDLDPHPQPHGRLLGGAGGDRGGRARRAGSTPATSPAPTRTATSGSSAARSR